MNATASPVTHYQSSKGLVPIAGMVHTHLRNAAEKLRREGREPATLHAMDAQLAYLDSLPDDAARIAATSPQTAPAIGHNAPPTAPLTFDEIKAKIDDLYAEAKNWLDGVAITTQAQADEVSRLKGMIKEAEGQADTLRKSENKSFDDGKAEVQAKYAPLISDTKSVKGLTVVAVEACNAALLPWLKRLDEELQRERERKQAEADAKIEEAQTLAQAADSANLADREVVEEAVQDAKSAIREVRAVEDTRARAGGGAYRSTLLKDNWVATLTDGDAAMAHYWKMRRGDVETFLTTLATADAKAGKITIPGFDVENQKRAA